MAQSVSSRAWVTSGDPRPISARWAEATRKMQRLGFPAPGGPMTEATLFDLNLQIEKLSKPVVEVDEERLRCAEIDLKSEIASHTQLREKIIKEQRQLEPISDEHRLLADISAAMLRKPEETQACVDRLWPRAPRQEGYRLPGEISRPAFSGPDAVDQFRAATRAMQVENQKLADLLTDIAKIGQHDAMPMSDRNRRMIWKLYATVNAMAERIDYLESIVTAKPTKQKRSA
jgi:hypothetical protein